MTTGTLAKSMETEEFLKNAQKKAAQSDKSSSGSDILTGYGVERLPTSSTTHSRTNSPSLENDKLGRMIIEEHGMNGSPNEENSMFENLIEEGKYDPLRANQESPNAEQSFYNELSPWTVDDFVMLFYFLFNILITHFNEIIKKIPNYNFPKLINKNRKIRPFSRKKGRSVENKFRNKSENIRYNTRSQHKCSGNTDHDKQLFNEQAEEQAFSNFSFANQYCRNEDHALSKFSNTNHYLKSEYMNNQLTSQEPQNQCRKRVKTDENSSKFAKSFLEETDQVSTSTLQKNYEENFNDEKYTASQDARENERRPGSIKKLVFIILKDGALSGTELQLDSEARSKLELESEFKQIKDSKLEKLQQSELRKVQVSGLLNGPCKLLLDKEYGKEFEKALMQEIWFRTRGISKEDFTKKWFSIWKRPVMFNGKMKKIKSFGPLYEVMGNQGFSETDNIREMRDEEFYKKASFSTFQLFLKEGTNYFETWVNRIKETGQRPDKKSESILTDSQKREMWIKSKDKIRDRFSNPQEHISYQKEREGKLSKMNSKRPKR